MGHNQTYRNEDAENTKQATKVETLLLARLNHPIFFTKLNLSTALGQLKGVKDVALGMLIFRGSEM